MRREALERARARPGGFDHAIARWSMRNQVVNEPSRRRGDFLNGLLEHDFVLFRWLCGAAQFTHKLQSGCAHFVVRCRWSKVGEYFDVSTHSEPVKTKSVVASIWRLSLGSARGAALVGVSSFLFACAGDKRPAAPGEGPLNVFNAASLGPPFRDVLATFAKENGAVETAQLNVPSLEAIRMLTELGRVPDILAVADRALLDSLVLGKHSSWYALFGTNALVLAYGDKSKYRDEITTENWWRVITRPAVAVGRSDMRVDPSGYRADMAMQLAEWHYNEPGLTARLRATIPEANVRRAEADLSAHIALGELDYGWTYESLAKAHKLSFVRLPEAIDLSDPSRGDQYARAHVSLPQPNGRPTLDLRGAPIVFALTIPSRAEHPELAARFFSFVLSPTGRAILERSGFRPLAKPVIVGQLPSTLAQFAR